MGLCSVGFVFGSNSDLCLFLFWVDIFLAKLMFVRLGLLGFGSDSNHLILVRLEYGLGCYFGSDHSIRVSFARSKISEVFCIAAGLICCSSKVHGIVKYVLVNLISTR